ncbi:hypothetical protein [Bacillus paranthracis]
MLDWMKKLFNKEEEQTAMNKEVQKQVESQPKVPRVNHYTEAREAQMASRNAGKCRFPLVPDNGFDEEDVIETGHFEEQPVQAVTYENQPIQRGIKVERSRRQYVEKVVSTYEEPEMQYEPEREPVVKKASAPAQESNRRPFRPTEMISPIYGYNRPSVEKKEEKQEEVKEREDLEISVEGKSVVDAWLEKKGYTLSDFSEGQAPTSSSHRAANEQGEQQYEESKKEEKSVVDQWLEKNGYEIERQEPIVEEKEVVQEMSAPQEVPAAELLHETIAERMEGAKQESDVVDKNILQEELVDSKVEHEDTILSEEIKRSTEIEQPTIEVEKQAPEESVIVKAEEKLEETIVVEIPEEVKVIAEAEESGRSESNCRSRRVRRSGSNCRSRRVRRSGSNCRSRRVRRSGSNCRSRRVRRSGSNCRSGRTRRSGSNCGNRRARRSRSNCGSGRAKRSRSNCRNRSTRRSRTCST